MAIDTTSNNRMAEPQTRGPGRPSQSNPIQPQKDAEIAAITGKYVPALNCPTCGRGMTPRVERWLPNGDAACMCSLSGCRFVYTPPKVRAK